ncbi:MAG: hypothetical protein K2M42_09800 [Oscillospiraceae bacterium]|nr:hypothetical protein [Oscillospiraceae bacterium]
MDNYCIGIIDEDQGEVLDIKRTIHANKPAHIAEELIQFVDYPLPTRVTTLSDEVSKAVIRDIVGGSIHALIVDYRIIVESTCIEGTEIFKQISSLVSKFPTIILTNVPDACYDKPFVDADKVYGKHDFFKIEESYSQEKTLNIFRNIDNYKKQRALLSVSLAEQLLKLESQGYVPETYQKIIELENALDDYLPQEQTIVEKELNLSDLKGAVELIAEANQLLGDRDEN